MSDLTSIERIKLEKMLGMNGGYVLDFSNTTFQQFILEITNKDIYSIEYEGLGSSKANRLRCFWKIESNYMVAKVILGLLEHWKTKKLLWEDEIEKREQEIYEECQFIADKLYENLDSEHIADITQINQDDEDFSILSKDIRENIENNQPALALDRLHTFAMKHIRRICDKHDIRYDKSKPLHSSYGEYIKFLRRNNLLESEMTERILKTSISLMDAFNPVRNDKSFAHDNDILNYNESMLIFKNVSSVIAFIESIEGKQNKSKSKENEIDWNSLPF